MYLEMPDDKLTLPTSIGKYSGPISSEMALKLGRLKSSYTDEFDWTVYDRLYEKFGNNQPRGGVVFRTALKLVNHHSQCSKCHYALEIDTYGRGCIHNCIYCYAKDQLTLRGYWNRPHPMPVDLSEIRKIFNTVFETDAASKWRNILSARVPIRIGSMSDSFMWMDKKYGVTLEFLKILKFYRYPYIIFTRSDLVAEDEYLAVLDKKLASVQFSISGNNEDLTRKMEPGAPTVKRRLLALRKLSEHEIWTTVRLNPLFPTYPDGFFTDQRSLKGRFLGDIPRLDLLNIDNVEEFLISLKESRVPSLLAGFVRLNQTSISQLSKACNIPFREFFKPENYKPRGESHYTDSEIAYYYKIIQSKAERLGIRFSTCYIGNPAHHYSTFQNLWSNKSDCCDAIGNVEAFKTTSQAIPWDERIKHASNKAVAEQTQLLDELIEENTSGFEPSAVTAQFGAIKGLAWNKAKKKSAEQFLE